MQDLLARLDQLFRDYELVFIVSLSLLGLVLMLAARRQLPPRLGLAFRVLAMAFVLWLGGPVLALVLLTGLACELALPRVRDGAKWTDAEGLRSFTQLTVRGLPTLAGWLALEHANAVYPNDWGMAAHDVPTWLQVLIIVPLIDLKQYGLHRMQHQFEWWWWFHQAHHAPRPLNVMVSARTNMIESTLIQDTTAFGIAYVTGVSPTAFIVYHFLALLVGSVFSHANVRPRKKLAWYNYIINTPTCHTLHHTKKHDRKNYAEIFILWDRMFGTFQDPTEEGPTPIPAAEWEDFGTDEEFPTESLLAQHWYPFRRIYHRLLGRDRPAGDASAEPVAQTAPRS